VALRPVSSSHFFCLRTETFGQQELQASASREDRHLAAHMERLAPGGLTPEVIPFRAFSAPEFDSPAGQQLCIIFSCLPFLDVMPLSDGMDFFRSCVLVDLT